MNPYPVRTWDELRPLLDCSYRGGNGDETLARFRAQRSEAAKRFPGPAIPLPSLRGQSTDWASSLFNCCPELGTLMTGSASYFETVAFLSELLKESAAGSPPDDRQRRRVLTLQKRFEVNRRLFDCYDQDMRRVGDNFMDLDAYALLALSLQIMYLGSNCFSTLNTAIKLLDFIALSGWHANRPQLPALAFALEKAILDELDPT